MTATSEENGWAAKLAHWRRYGLGVMRSGASTSTRTSAVVHEHTGEPVGERVEHWDGRVDGHARRFDVQVNPALKLKEAR